MSKYTTEVRFICETLAGYVEQQGFGNIDDILTKAAPLVFDFDFPIFDEDYRLGLEKKILRHFYTREISEESVGLWKLRLSDKLNVIMPYYNKLYESELLEFDPLGDVDLSTTSTTTGSGETTGEKTGSTTTKGESTEKEVYTGNDSKNTTYSEDSTRKNTTSNTSTTTGSDTDTMHSVDAYSDTPQGALTDVENLAYLTNARIIDQSNKGTNTSTTTGNGTNNTTNDVDGKKNENGSQDYTKTTTGSSSSNGTSNTTENGTSKSTEDYIQKITGKRSLSSFSKYLSEFRETFLNIDAMILKDLSDLFINLW